MRDERLHGERDHHPAEVTAPEQRAGSAAWHAEHGSAAGIDADVLAQLLAALYDGLVLAWLADPEGTDPAAVFALLSRMLTAVGERPDGE